MHTLGILCDHRTRMRLKGEILQDRQCFMD